MTQVSPSADDRPLLVRVSGADRPRITHDLLTITAASGAVVEDMEQLVVRERLTLDLLLRIDGADDALVKDILFWSLRNEMSVDFERVESRSQRSTLPRHAVTVLGAELSAADLASVTEVIAATGGNIDRIVRLATEPVVAYDFVVIADDLDTMRLELVRVARDRGLDVAVQRNGLERRAKRLVVMDVDSTLIQDEVIDLLADQAGCSDQVTAITARAMAGELDFEASLRERVRLLAGVPTSALDRVIDRIRLTPGARTFVTTLKRLGYAVGIVSGGFTVFTDHLKADLDLDYAYANTLEIRDGRLTGELLGPVVDRARKAELLAEIAALERITVAQAVAVGDGANDLDMLAASGLGIAFNAKQIVRDQAQASISVPHLDAILFMLGLRGADVEQVD